MAKYRSKCFSFSVLQDHPNVDMDSLNLSVPVNNSAMVPDAIRHCDLHLQSILSELPSISRHLVPAKRHVVLQCTKVIDEQRPCLDGMRHTKSPSAVLREHSCGEPEFTVIGDFDGLCE